MTKNTLRELLKKTQFGILGIGTYLSVLCQTPKTEVPQKNIEPDRKSNITSLLEKYSTKFYQPEFDDNNSASEFPNESDNKYPSDLLEAGINKLNTKIQNELLFAYNNAQLFCPIDEKDTKYDNIQEKQERGQKNIVDLCKILVEINNPNLELHLQPSYIEDQCLKMIQPFENDKPDYL